VVGSCVADTYNIFVFLLIVWRWY